MNNVRTRGRLLVAVTVTLLTIGAVAQSARAEVKIGCIDSAQIFKDYSGTSDAQRAFDEQFAEWTKEDEQRRAEIDSLEIEFKSQSLMLTEATRREKEQVLSQKKGEYEQFTREIWGPQGRVAAKNFELSKPIFDTINQILERIAAEEDYMMIFDVASGGVVYRSPTIDLTQRIIEELNKGAQ